MLQCKAWNQHKHVRMTLVTFFAQFAKPINWEKVYFPRELIRSCSKSNFLMNYIEEESARVSRFHIIYVKMFCFFLIKREERERGHPFKLLWLRCFMVWWSKGTNNNYKFTTYNKFKWSLFTYKSLTIRNKECSLFRTNKQSASHS